MDEIQGGAVARTGMLEPGLWTPWRERKERIAERSSQFVAAYPGEPSESELEDWKAQQARFHVLAEALPLNGRRVLDVGCGFADFADYLTVNYGPVCYEGVDICPAVIEEAQKRHPWLPLSVLDILEEEPGGPYDFVVGSGLFYSVGDDSSGGDAFAFVRALISRMFELSSCAVAFTTPSAWAERRRPGEFHADPLKTVAFCRTLTPRVTLRHDYLPNDLAIFLFHGVCPEHEAEAGS